MHKLMLDYSIYTDFKTLPNLLTAVPGTYILNHFLNTIISISNLHNNLNLNRDIERKDRYRNGAARMLSFFAEDLDEHI